MIIFEYKQRNEIQQNSKGGIFLIILNMKHYIYIKLRIKSPKLQTKIRNYETFLSTTPEKYFVIFYSFIYKRRTGARNCLTFSATLVPKQMVGYHLNSFKF